jgi:Tannase and feruloyl esterase
MIKYYEDMAQRFGGLEQAQQFSRLYPIPNMGRCAGGPATDQFNLLTPLANWVENGTPPAPINATGVNFTPASSRLSAGNDYSDAPVVSLSPAGPPYRERIDDRRCARCEQSGGFGRSDKISMHRRESVGTRSRE